MKFYVNAVPFCSFWRDQQHLSTCISVDFILWEPWKHIRYLRLCLLICHRWVISDRQPAAGQRVHGSLGTTLSGRRSIPIVTMSRSDWTVPLEGHAKSPIDGLISHHRPNTSRIKRIVGGSCDFLGHDPPMTLMSSVFVLSTKPLCFNEAPAEQRYKHSLTY